MVDVTKILNTVYFPQRGCQPFANSILLFQKKKQNKNKIKAKQKQKQNSGNFGREIPFGKNVSDLNFHRGTNHLGRRGHEATIAIRQKKDSIQSIIRNRPERTN